jgi:hypothetical protein
VEDNRRVVANFFRAEAEDVEVRESESGSEISRGRFEEPLPLPLPIPLMLPLLLIAMSLLSSSPVASSKSTVSPLITREANATAAADFASTLLVLLLLLAGTLCACTGSCRSSVRPTS